MTAVVPALRAGVGRGLIELRQAFTGMELVGQLLWPVATLAAVTFLRDVAIGGSGATLGTMILPGALGMFVALGMLLVVQQLAADREDGTLLRAKATPNGIRAYLVGKLVQISATILAYLAIILIPGVFLVEGLEIADPSSWITFAWVLALGLVATQAIGVLLGSMIATPRGAGYLSLPILGLIAISGIFAPITGLPEWLQWIAQVFPIYWLGLGMRASFLPDDAVVVEIGESWRQLETAAVLGAWAIVGLVLAPMVLRRMTRRESGSRVAERREQALRRVG
ncbi:ABC-2 type transport system permease protein [Agromyces hippuratus]|uniref:ABC-2 type transport system permease protein n=1 Tax=Agromyces hippuratus TaxID=286438 RepID=A0A852XA12_9MICO|nr:ABC transporter permease [Agromyces hippuratus]NYG22685.1 ABC-2 type transport system permease protein [Agromyces hippuratus]